MREELIARVQAHAALTEAEANDAVVAVLRGLRAELGRPEAEALAERLPDELAALLDEPATGGRSLPEGVAAALSIPVGPARERIGAVCVALAALLPEALVARLADALSPETAAWLAPPAPERHARPMHPPVPRDTLSDGRPGSVHPISEARPPGAHAGSVAAANPHGETKLSSGRPRSGRTPS